MSTPVLPCFPFDETVNMLTGLDATQSNRSSNFGNHTVDDNTNCKWSEIVNEASKIRRQPAKYDLRFFRSWTMPDERDAKLSQQKRNIISANMVHYKLQKDDIEENKDLSKVRSNNKMVRKEFKKTHCVSAPTISKKYKFLTEFESKLPSDRCKWRETIPKANTVNLNIKVFQPRNVAIQRKTLKQSPLGVSRSHDAEVLSFEDDQIVHDGCWPDKTGFHRQGWMEKIEVVSTSLKIPRPTTVGYAGQMFSSYNCDQTYNSNSSTQENSKFQVSWPIQDGTKERPATAWNSELPAVLDNYDELYNEKLTGKGSGFKTGHSAAKERKEKCRNWLQEKSLKIVFPRSDNDTNNISDTRRKSNSIIYNDTTPRTGGCNSKLETVLSIDKCTMGQKIDQNAKRRKNGQDSKHETVKRQSANCYKNQRYSGLEVTYDLKDEDEHTEMITSLESSNENNIAVEEITMDSNGTGNKDNDVVTNKPEINNSKEDASVDSDTTGTLLRSRLALAGLSLSPHFNISVSGPQAKDLEANTVDLKGIYTMKNLNTKAGSDVGSEEAAERERYRKLFGDGKTKRIVRFSVANQVHEYDK